MDTAKIREIVQISFKASLLKKRWCDYYLFCLYGNIFSSNWFNRSDFVKIGFKQNLNRIIRYLINSGVISKNNPDKRKPYYIPDYRILYLLAFIPDEQIPKKQRGKSMKDKIKKHADSYLLTFKSKSYSLVQRDPFLSNEEIILYFSEDQIKNIKKKYSNLNKMSLSTILENIQDIYSHRLVRWVCFHPLYSPYVSKRGIAALTELMRKVLPNNYGFEQTHYFFEFIKTFRKKGCTKEEQVKMFKYLFVYSTSNINYQKKPFLINQELFSAYSEEVNKLIKEINEKELTEFFNDIWKLYNLDRFLSILFAQSLNRLETKQNSTLLKVIKTLGHRKTKPN